jgi:MFS family permease
MVLCGIPRADISRQGVLGGLVTQPTFLDAIGNPSALFLGTIVALYDIGCLAGCVLSAVWGNKIGRRRSVLWASSVMVIGAIVQASCNGPGQLIAGRLISGLGNGMSSGYVLRELAHI